MFDAATAFDTIVVDDPDEPATVPVIARVTTAELTMQIQVLGQWHRRTPDLAETACGVPVRLVETPTRREQLTCADGGLCGTCFTPHEIDRARRNDEEAERRRIEEDERWFAEAEQRRSKRRTGDQ